MLLATKHINRVFVNYYYDKIIILIPLFMIKEDSRMFRSYSWLCKCHLSSQNSFSFTKKRGEGWGDHWFDGFILKQYCLMELSGMMKMCYICHPV